MVKKKTKKSKPKKAAKKTTKKFEQKIEREVEQACCEAVECCEHPGNWCSGGGVYGFGFIGAVIYYISTATGFWNGVLGVLKALVWPVFLVLEALRFLKA